MKMHPCCPLTLPCAVVRNILVNSGTTAPCMSAIMLDNEAAAVSMEVNSTRHMMHCKCCRKSPRRISSPGVHARPDTVLIMFLCPAAVSTIDGGLCMTASRAAGCLAGVVAYRAVVGIAGTTSVRDDISIHLQSLAFQPAGLLQDPSTIDRINKSRACHRQALYRWPKWNALLDGCAELLPRKAAS